MPDSHPRYFVTYYADGEYLEQDEYAEIPPVIGQGVSTQGRFYRIVDVWNAVVTQSSRTTQGAFSW